MSQKLTRAKVFSRTKMWIVAECSVCGHAVYFENEEYITATIKLKTGLLDVFDYIMRCCPEPQYFYYVNAMRYAKVPRGASRTLMSTLDYWVEEYLKSHPSKRLITNGP